MDTISKDKTKMKHFRKWAEGKDSDILEMSFMIASLAKEYYELSKSIHDGKRFEGDIPLPSLRTWIKLYHNPKRIGKVLINSLGLKDDKAEKRNKDSNEEIDESVALKDEVIVDFSNEERKEFLQYLTKPEIIFFIRVVAPCFTFYKTYPIELLKKAKSGDDDALEKLIRLDKSVIFEPKISEIIHEAQGLKKQERMSIIKRGFAKQPRAMKMKTIKLHLGGLISLFTMTLKKKMTARDIWELYDAISLDKNNDVDEDFKGMSEEAFSKDIQDARKMWQNVIFSGKIMF